MDQREPRPWKDLERLVGSLFGPDELRHWIRHEYPDVAHDLPGEIASHTAHVSAAVAVLKRHGLVDDEFFERLTEERPRRHAEIVAVQRAILDAVVIEGPRQSDIDPRRTVPPNGGVHNRPGRLLGYCAGICAVVWLFAILYSGGQAAALQKSVFGFLPVVYQRFGFLGVSGLAALASGLYRVFGEERS